MNPQDVYRWHAKIADSGFIIECRLPGGMMVRCPDCDEVVGEAGEAEHDLCCTTCRRRVQ